MITFPALNSCAKKAEEQSQVMEMMIKYSENEGVEYMNLKGFLLNFAKPAMKDTPMRDLTDCIENICIFSMGKVSDATRKEFNKESKELLKNYEKIVEKKEGKENEIIYVKKLDEETISEMLIYSEKEKTVMVLICGKIPVAELEKAAKTESVTEEA